MQQNIIYVFSLQTWADTGPLSLRHIIPFAHTCDGWRPCSLRLYGLFWPPISPTTEEIASSVRGAAARVRALGHDAVKTRCIGAGCYDQMIWSVPASSLTVEDVKTLWWLLASSVILFSNQLSHQSMRRKVGLAHQAYPVWIQPIKAYQATSTCHQQILSQPEW